MLVAELGDRAFGLLMLVFALPNLVPLGVPGVSAILGLPLVFLSAQFAFGRPVPWFPSWLASRTFSRHDFKRVVNWSVPYLERLERLLRPRLNGLFSVRGERRLGWFSLVLSILIVLPIPLGNWLPALAVAIIGLAIIERDGWAAIAGIVVGCLSFLVVATVIATVIEVTQRVIESVFG